MASTAAHLHFPCGTVLRITNPQERTFRDCHHHRSRALRKGQGPRPERGTARRLGLEWSGLGEVLIEVLR
jgi:hypothetical protein